MTLMIMMMIMMILGVTMTMRREMGMEVRVATRLTVSQKVMTKVKKNSFQELNKINQEQENIIKQQVTQNQSQKVIV